VKDGIEKKEVLNEAARLSEDEYGGCHCISRFSTGTPGLQKR
jgi:hypothetical protein